MIALICNSNSFYPIQCIDRDGTLNNMNRFKSVVPVNTMSHDIVEVI